MKLESRAPLIFAIVVLLLPVLYLGGYAALVDPPGKAVPYGSGRECYRAGRQWSATFFWPVEKIDRQVRPNTWRRPSFIFDIREQSRSSRV